MATTFAEVQNPETGEPIEPVEDPETDEPVEPATEPDDEPAEPQEPAEPAGEAVTEKEIERVNKKLEAEASRHANRVSEIMGEAAQALVVCELCLPHIPGFRPPLQPPDEVKDLVRAAIGDAPVGDFNSAPAARTCDDCAGRGQVLTGSLVPEHRTKLCERCGGTGWVDTRGGASAPVAAAAPAAPPPEGSTSAEAPPDVDPWGRRRGDPDFGRMPGYQ